MTTPNNCRPVFRHSNAKRAAWSFFLVTLVSALSWPVLAQEGETESDGSIPTLAELVERLEANEEGIRTVSVNIDHSRFVPPSQQSGGLTGFFVGRWHYESGGKARYDGIYEQTETNADTGAESTRTREVTLAFDGRVARQLEVSFDDQVKQASVFNHVIHFGVDPRELTTRHLGQSVSKLLGESGDKVRRKKLKGSEVLVVDTKPVTNEHDWKSRFWIDPKHGYAVVRRAALIKLEGQTKWQEYTRVRCWDLVEAQPGIWLPTRYKFESLDIRPSEKEARLAWRYEGRASHSARQ